VRTGVTRRKPGLAPKPLHFGHHPPERPVDPLVILAALLKGERPAPGTLDGESVAAVGAWLARPPGELAQALGVGADAVARLRAMAGALGAEAGDGELIPQARRPGPPRGAPPPAMHGRVLGALVGSLGGLGKLPDGPEPERDGAWPKGLRRALECDGEPPAAPGPGGSNGAEALVPGALDGLSPQVVEGLRVRGVATLGELAAANPLDLIGVAQLRYSGAFRLVGLARRALGTGADQPRV